MIKKSFVITLFTCVSSSPLFADTWTAFRGAAGRGVSDEKNLPVEWSESKNLAWTSDLVANRGQREINEESLRATFFQKGAKDNEQNNVSRQHIGHDAEYAITLVENTDAKVGKGVTGMLYDLWHQFTVAIHTIQQHDGTDYNEHGANHQHGEDDEKDRDEK